MLPFEIKRRWPARPGRTKAGGRRGGPIHQPPRYDPPPAVTPWYLQGGISAANCIAVYDPWGAKNATKALENVVNPGTYDAVAGAAPAWAKGTGWTFNGTTHYLRCSGLNAPNDNGWTYICWFKGVTGTTGVLLGATDGVTVSYLYLSPGWSGTQARWCNDTNATALDVTPNRSEGVMAMGGTTAYMNGVSAGTMNALGGNNGWEIWLGCRNNRGAAANFLAGTICRVAIYNTVLTADQVKAVTRAIRTLAVAVGDSVIAGSYYVSEAEKAFTLLCTAKGWEKQNNGLGSTPLQNSVQNQVAVIGGAVTNNGRDTYVSNIVNYTPKWVFILHGLNDLRLDDPGFSVASFQNDLGEIVDGLIAGGVLAGNIVIGSPPYMLESAYSSYAPWDAGSRAKHAQHVAAAAAVAAAKNTRYVDVYQWLADNGGDSLFGVDGVHPNVAGQAQIAAAFASVL